MHPKSTLNCSNCLNFGTHRIKTDLEFENISNLPWIEIDFKKDLDLAKKNILKKIDE